MLFKLYLKEPHVRLTSQLFGKRQSVKQPAKNGQLASKARHFLPAAHNGRTVHANRSHSSESACQALASLNSQVTRRSLNVCLKDIVKNSIFDIVLEFNPNTILNIDTPDNALVGEVEVISSNPDGVYRVTISPDDPHFYLDPETFELRLKKSGAILFKDINSVLLAITATEIGDPRISLTVKALKLHSTRCQIATDCSFSLPEIHSHTD